jgi:glucoselysine-6-phosphate deglycase
MRMQDYVRYSPEQLAKNQSQGERLVRGIVRVYRKRTVSSLVLVASGSSLNGAMMVAQYLMKATGKNVITITPESILAGGALIDEHSFVIVMSQSGASTNIIAALKYFQDEGIETVSLTGNIESPMREYSDRIFDYGVGNEYVDFVTMGVQTLVEFFLMFGLALGSDGISESTLKDLGNTIRDQDTVINTAEAYIKKHKLQLAQQQPAFFVGNGPNYGVAKEGALKFQEALKRPAMYYELEEFLHGPDMQLSPDYTVFLLDDLNTASRFDEVFTALHLITPNIHFVTSRHFSEKVPNDVINIPGASSSELVPLLTLPVIQLISAEMADIGQTWETTPFFAEFDQKIAIKTKDYQKELKSIQQEWEKDQQK